MSDCVMCKCDTLTPSASNCQHLHDQNDEKVRELAIIYRDLQTCNLAEYGAKGFYNVWCVLKNLIAQVCWISGQVGGEKTSVVAGEGISVSKQGEAFTVTNTWKLPNFLGGNGISVRDTPKGKEISLTKPIPNIQAGNGIKVINGADGLVTIENGLTLQAGNGISITGGNGSPTVITAKPKDVDLSGYVPKLEYDKVKNALDKIIQNLEASGAWSGGINGNFRQGRNIATGNINIFGGTPDGNSFIRTNNGRTENDLAGGI